MTTDKPKLKMPGSKPPAQPAVKVKPPKPQKPIELLQYGDACQRILQETVEQVGFDRHVIFDAMTKRIFSDPELFDRMSKAMIAQFCRKAIKRKLMVLEEIRQHVEKAKR